jgi:hypothetical protein
VNDLGLHEAFAVLTAAELEDIAGRATRQAEALRTGNDGTYSRGWVLIFDYLSMSARHALAVRELTVSDV